MVPFVSLHAVATPAERRLYGHRGSSQNVPENTLPAFRQALADGANALEMDVHVTADGHVVVSHDADGRRRAGIDRAIADCTQAEVQRWVVGRLPDGTPTGIPTFDDVLTSFPSVRLNVDIKPSGTHAVPLVIDVIRRRRAEDRVTLASFHGDVISTIRSMRYGGELSLPPADVVRVRLLPWLVLRRFPPRGQAIQIPTRQRGLRLDTPEFIERCHSLGLRVDYWVINDSAEAARLLSAGADGLVSDDPGALRTVVFGEMAGRR